MLAWTPVTLAFKPSTLTPAVLATLFRVVTASLPAASFTLPPLSDNGPTVMPLASLSPFGTV